MRWWDVSGMFGMSVMDFLGMLPCWLKSNQAALRRRTSKPTTADAMKLRRSKLKGHLIFAVSGYHPTILESRCVASWKLSRNGVMGNAVAATHQPLSKRLWGSAWLPVD